MHENDDVSNAEYKPKVTRLRRRCRYLCTKRAGRYCEIREKANDTNRKIERDFYCQGKCGLEQTNVRFFLFLLFLPRRFATLRITKCVKGDQGAGGRELVRGSVGRNSILLLVYPRQRDSYRAATMSLVMPTVCHCPVLPGVDIFVGSRAESGNFASDSLKDSTAVFSNCAIAFCHASPRSRHPSLRLV